MSKVLKGQCFLDMSIQDTGTIESVVEIAVNNNMSVTEILKVSSIIEIPEVSTIDKKAKNYYKVLELKPASDTVDAQKIGGIGYMGIEIDFIVSKE